MKNRITGLEVNQLDKRIKVMVCCPVCGAEDNRIYTKEVRFESDAILSDDSKIPSKQRIIVDCYCNNCNSKFNISTNKAIVVGWTGRSCPRFGYCKKHEKFVDEHTECLDEEE